MAGRIDKANLTEENSRSIALAMLRERVFLKSPVRENRTLGSVRRLLGNWQSYRDGRLISCLLLEKVVAVSFTVSNRATVHVYHFAKVEHLDNILAEGLKTLSRFHRLPSTTTSLRPNNPIYCGSSQVSDTTCSGKTIKYGCSTSRLRQNAVYAWLAPSHDRMGYKENSEYICLKLTVPQERCFVANMDLISAAWANWIGAGGQPKDRVMAEKLIHAYEEAAVPINRYQSGLFRAPEVIIRGTIEPACITLCPSKEKERFENNEKRYQDHWECKLRRLADFADQKTFSSVVETLVRRCLIRRVAVHDDSNGWLGTYILESENVFFTIHLGQVKPLFLAE